MCDCVVECVEEGLCGVFRFETVLCVYVFGVVLNEWMYDFFKDFGDR